MKLYAYRQVVVVIRDCAAMPVAPVVKMHVPAADTEAADWRYATEQPGEDWFKAEFGDSQWREGRGLVLGNVVPRGPRTHGVEHIRYLAASQVRHGRGSACRSAIAICAAR